MESGSSATPVTTPGRSIQYTMNSERWSPRDHQLEDAVIIHYISNCTARAIIATLQRSFYHRNNGRNNLNQAELFPMFIHGARVRPVYLPSLRRTVLAQRCQFLPT